MTVVTFYFQNKYRTTESIYPNIEESKTDFSNKKKPLQI